jgi:hypothetical protein
MERRGPLQKAGAEAQVPQREKVTPSQQALVTHGVSSA